MQTAMSTELRWMVMSVVLTSIIFVPYIVNRMSEHGIWPALWNPRPDTRPRAQWAERAMRAHANAVENLVIFAPLVLALQVVGVTTAATATACMVYFFARLAHVLFYTFAVPAPAHGGVRHRLRLPDDAGAEPPAIHLIRDCL